MGSIPPAGRVIGLYLINMEKSNKWHSISPEQLWLYAVLVFIVFFGLSLSKAGVIADSDEALFHFPNVENFYRHGLAAMFNDKYSAANTPLPYILVAFIAKFFGPGLLLARIVTAVFSLAAFYLSIRILKLLGAPVYYALGILFYPYFFNNSFVFYVINFGLFFFLWAFYLLKKREASAGYFSDFLIGFLLSMAILCQQFYLIVPGAIIIHKLVRLIGNKQEWNFTAVRRFMLSSFLLTVPLALPAALFMKWGGLTHPNFNVHSLSFYPSTLVAILFVTGFYFFLFALQSYKQFRIADYAIAAFFSIVGVVRFAPVFSNEQGPGLFTGIAFHVITLSGKAAGFLPLMAMGVLCFTGVLVCIAIVRRCVSPWEKMTAYAGALLAIGYAVNTQIGERHLLGLLVLMMLLILPGYKKPLITGQLFWMILVGVAYFFYWNFFKFQ
jgi:hypothetical protein